MDWITKIIKPENSTTDTGHVENSTHYIKKILGKGLSYFYNAGNDAITKPISSELTINDTRKIENMFFEFQKLRGLPEEWPKTGLTIEDCVAFMITLAESGRAYIDTERITKNYFLKNVTIFGKLLNQNCPEFKRDYDFNDKWNKAKENIGRDLSQDKREVYHFDMDDMKKFMTYMLSTESNHWLKHRQVMLWASILFFTGMRPGEAAYTKGHKDDKHYLRVGDIQVECFEVDTYGVRFSITITIGWMKNKRFSGKTFTRRLISSDDPTLFYIDPTLHLVAHLYTLGCFGNGTIDEIFQRDVITFPFEEDTLDFPILFAHNARDPISAHRMTQNFKEYASRAGLPDNIVSYSCRSGFVRDLFAMNMPDEKVKKLLHHSSSSSVARQHYEGEVTNIDVVAHRSGRKPIPPGKIDTFDKTKKREPKNKPKELTTIDNKRIKLELFSNDHDAREAREEYIKLSKRIKALKRSSVPDTKRIERLNSLRETVKKRYSEKLEVLKQKEISSRNRNPMTRKDLAQLSCEQHGFGDRFKKRLDMIKWLTRIGELSKGNKRTKRM